MFDRRAGFVGVWGHLVDVVFLTAFDALGLDAEYADYDMDSDDEDFIKTFKEVRSLTLLILSLW